MALPVVSAETKARTGRYSASVMTPTESQHDPLSMVVVMNFHSDIETVGDAIQFVLGPTGYKVPENVDWLDPAFVIVGNKALPISQRRMSGAVNDVLRALTGRYFVVVRDDVNRLVTMDYMEKWEDE
jgi:type IV pili sensor histidine kinase/response regulator